ncbi:hypothetical protein EV426DRAFT_616109, partial [Tirmania nivea]
MVIFRGFLRKVWMRMIRNWPLYLVHVYLFCYLACEKARAGSCPGVSRTAVTIAMPPRSTLPWLRCRYCHASYVDIALDPLSTLPCLLCRHCLASDVNIVTPL